MTKFNSTFFSIVFFLIQSIVAQETNTTKINFLGSNTSITSISSKDLRIENDYGSVDIGPKNPDWCHIYTTMPRFILNRPIYSLNGVFSAYNTSNLSLQTNGTTRMTILNSNGNVGIGVNRPDQKFEVNGDVSFDRKGVDYTALNIGHKANTSIFADNSIGKDHGGGMFFRVHDESVAHKYQDAITITGKGNVGIGTSTPKNKLSVKGHRKLR